MASKRELKVTILGDDRSGGAFDSAGGRADGLGGKFAGFAVAAAAAFAAVVVAAGTAGTALYSIGANFDDAYDSIRVGTGKTGQSLGQLQDDFRAVVSKVPTDFGSASTAIADINTRLGLTGEPLQKLSTQFLEVSRITGTDLTSNIDKGTAALNNFNVPAADQPAILDQLFRASQASGVSFGDLTSQLGESGTQLRAVGFDITDSTALIATLGKAGLSTSDIMPGLARAMANAAKDGRSASDVFGETFQKIRSAPDDTAAAGIALEVFGAKGGPKLAAMIREGKLSYEDMMAAVSGGTDTVAAAAADTADFSEKWTVFKNRVLLVLEPIATRVFDGMGRAMDRVSVVVETRVMPVLEQMGAWWNTNGPAILAVAASIGAGIAAAFDVVVKVIGFVMEHWRGLAQIVAAAVAVMSPVILILGLQYAALGIAATVSAVQSVAAWVAKQAAAVASGAVMLATSYRIVGQWIAMGVAATVGALKVVAGWVMTAAGALANVAIMAVQAALFVGHWVLMGAQALAQAARIAAAWLIAMGPVGLVIAAVVGLVAIVVANWDTIRAKTEQLWQAVKDVTAATWDWIRGAVNAAVGFLTSLFMNFTGPGLLIKHWDTIKSATGAAFDWVRGKVREGIDFIVGLFLNFTGPGLLIKHWDTIKGATAGAFEAVKDVVRGAVDAVTGFIGGLPGRAAGALGGLAGAITGVARGAWDAFAGAVRGGIDNAARTVSSLPGRVAGAVGDLGGLLSGAGRSVIDGFIRGVTSGFQKVRDTLSKLTGMLPDWKGPADTDKVILREAGQLVIGGFDDGLRSRFDQVKRTLGDLTDLAGMQAGGTAYVMGRLATDAPGGSGAAAAPAPAVAPVEQHVHYHADLSGIVEPTLSEDSVMQALHLVGMLYAPDATTP